MFAELITLVNHDKSVSTDLSTLINLLENSLPGRDLTDRIKLYSCINHVNFTIQDINEDPEMKGFYRHTHKVVVDILTDPRYKYEPGFIMSNKILDIESSVSDIMERIHQITNIYRFPVCLK